MNKVNVFLVNKEDKWERWDERRGRQRVQVQDIYTVFLYSPVLVKQHTHTVFMCPCEAACTHTHTHCIHVYLWSRKHTHTHKHIYTQIHCILACTCSMWWVHYAYWKEYIFKLSSDEKHLEKQHSGGRAGYLSSRQAGSIASVATQSAKGIQRNPVSKCPSTKDKDLFAYPESWPVLPLNLTHEVHFALLYVVIPCMLVLDTWLCYYCHLFSNLLYPRFFC